MAVQVRDALLNATTAQNVTFTWTDVALNADDFVGHASVGNSAKTVSWKT